MKTRKESEPPPERPARRGPRPPGFAWWQWLLAALVILVGSFGAGYFLSTQVLFPRPETAGMGVVVPVLFGETRSEAEAAIRAAGLEVGAVTEMASMSTDAGRVLAQDPVPGQQLRPGARVSFGVSGGPPELRVPPLEGMRVASARDLLESVGFQVDVRQLPAGEGVPGMVVRTMPAAGDALRLPAVVTLYTAAPPPQDSLAPAGREATGPTGAGGA